ncbi:FAD-binding-3 domain-containing protein [Mycena indigotica]|uniref:FAD-binding-3 domain-containing protein n=1 Tax=Mycena indigotica TaxID=2126181 RepID=A0A8H6S094_9AGAR|nr:FAD-binding-3 domain-containing protein [Mycena indigotica]KAF7289943.1 FAD-binding-3 domain-containing protein [Mycena indigotica]
MTQEKNLRFIIAGASAAGLTAAIALKVAGHDVLVLEKEGRLGGPDTIPSPAIRLPPNGCKILFDWGLEDAIRAYSIVGEGFTVWKYQGLNGARDFLGTHRWPAELLTDARGDFLQLRHKDLLKVLYDAALCAHTRKSTMNSSPVVVRFNAEVVDSDLSSNPHSPTVTLSSGEVLRADVIIGADGARGYFRKLMLAEEEEDTDADVPRGLAVYTTTIPKTLAMTDPLTAKLYDYPQSQMVTFCIGPNRGAQVLVSGAAEDLTFWVYTPDSDQDGSWTQPADRRITDVVGECDPLIGRLAQLAPNPATCVQIKNSYDLDSWVSGNLLVLGEAAHPFPTISLHTYSIAIEDGAFIGKIFSHTRDPSRISEFLNAFEEVRKPRCLHIYQSEKTYIDVMALPDGPHQEGRDAAMRANNAAGRNVMDSGDEDSLQTMWDDMRMVFGYDPADAADEWWISWGRLRNSPTVSKTNGIHLNGVSLHVGPSSDGDYY